VQSHTIINISLLLCSFLFAFLIRVSRAAGGLFALLIGLGFSFRLLGLALTALNRNSILNRL
jgi:hypothetical protein